MKYVKFIKTCVDVHYKYVYAIDHYVFYIVVIAGVSFVHGIFILEYISFDHK